MTMSAPEAREVLLAALARFAPDLNHRGGLLTSEYIAQVRHKLAIPCGVGERWSTFENLSRQSTPNLDPGIVEAWLTIDAVEGPLGQLDVLSGPIDPIWIPLLLPVAAEPDAIDSYLAWLRQTSSRDVAICIAIRTMRALTSLPSARALGVGNAPPNSDLLETLRRLAEGVCSVPVDHPANAAPVELAYGVLRMAFHLGDHSTAHETVIRVLFDALARGLAPLADSGVDVLPTPLLPWLDRLMPNRTALVVDCSLWCDDQDVAQELRTRFVALFKTQFFGDIVSLPGDPSSAWDCHVVNALAVCLAADIPLDGMPVPSWWTDMLESVAYHWGGWNFDVTAAQKDAVRGAWLIWSALGACSCLQQNQMPVWGPVRELAISTATAMRDPWLWHSSWPSPRTRDFLPYFVLKLALLEPALSCADVVEPFVGLTWDEDIVQLMIIELGSTNATLLSLLEKRKSQLAAHKLAMDLPNRSLSGRPLLTCPRNPDPAEA